MKVVRAHVWEIVYDTCQQHIWYKREMQDVTQDVQADVSDEVWENVSQAVKQHVSNAVWEHHAVR